MSGKKGFKAQASSSKAAFGGPSLLGGNTFGNATTFGAVKSSILSYVYEPPDLSSISNPAIVVAFKNLQKKDSTTKTKALEELDAFLTPAENSQPEVENAILEAWSTLYPRASIDSSRRVRGLAHALQGRIAAACGKRVAKHMPTVVGAWLSGTYDSDKAVKKFARDSFQLVFTSAEKQGGVWKAFRSPLFEYCRNALLDETPNTLSDERTVSPDDAEAKYARTVGTALLVLARALEVQPSGTAQADENFTMVVQSEKVWKHSASSDPFLRRAICKFLCACLDHVNDLLSSDVLQSTFLQEGLLHDQHGSMNDFLEAAIKLKEAHPSTWEAPRYSSSKKSLLKSLYRFLRRGSQGAHGGIWAQTARLLQFAPVSSIQAHRDDSQADAASASATADQSTPAQILSALREGIFRKDEPVASQTEALMCYLEVAERTKAASADPKAIQAFYRDSILPLVSSILEPPSPNQQWPVKIKINEPNQILVRAVKLAVPESCDIVLDTFRESSASIIESIQISQPAHSKNYSQFQDALITTVSRWYDMEAAILQADLGEKFRAAFVDMNDTQIHAAIEVLKAREGKPYSAAALLATATRKVPSTTIDEAVLRKELQQFAHGALPSLIASPSGPYLLNLLTSLGWSDEYRQTYAKGLDSLLSLQDHDLRLRTLMDVVAAPWPQDDAISVALFQAIEKSFDNARIDGEERWKVTEAALKNSGLPEEYAFKILSRMTEALPIITGAAEILGIVDATLRAGVCSTRNYIASSESSKLISLTISLSQLSLDEEAEPLKSASKAAANALLSNPTFRSQTASSMVKAIQTEVTTVSTLSLPIESVVAQAVKLLQDNKSQSDREIPSSILPGLEDCQTILRPYLHPPLDPSLSMTNPLGGLLYLVDVTDDASDPAPETRAFDSDGRSIAFRTLFYTLRLIKETDVFSLITKEHRTVIFRLITLFNQLATDHLSVPSDNAVWGLPMDHPDTEVADFIAGAQAQVSAWISGHGLSNDSFLLIDVDAIQKDINGNTIPAYYDTRACALIHSELHEKSGSTGNDTFELAARFASPTVSTKSNDPLHRCNELMSALTGLDERGLVDPDQRVLQILVLLNVLHANDDILLGKVPQRRRVILMQSLVTALETASSDLPAVSEALKLVLALLPGLLEIYGDFWETLVDVLVRCLQSVNSSLPTLHASLRLCSIIRASLRDDITEDLVEAWDAQQLALSKSLFELMARQSKLPDANHQPRRMVNAILARQVAASEQTLKSNDDDDMYPIVASEAIALQQAAFHILHDKIPKAQEQISIDAVLSKEPAIKLPVKLLSMVAESPDPEAVTHLKTDPDMPSPLATYLLAWKLVFDHWRNASYKLQSDYAACIKESGYLTSLLKFIFQALAARRGPQQIIKPSKFDIENYAPGQADTPYADAQHLLTHLYYLSLKHLPYLTKAWWRSDCPRPLEKPVEDWTEKHISPLVIRDELEAVAAWNPNPETSPGDPALEIKISPRAREVVASYPVDETAMAIRVILPAAYPLQPVSFTTAQRVAVDEKRWATWLNTSHIVANFASTSQGLGCVVDGLVVWRRNVVGTMKSQSECAICYSVVSPDKMLPTKRCGTCKNIFHGHCLLRWFKSSSTSSCPLCRNPFHYG